MPAALRWLITVGLIVLAGLAAVSLAPLAAEESQPEGVYELRVYTTHEGRLPALEERFRSHTMKLFEKHGMKNVMYWKPTDAARSENTLIYVLWHASEEAAKDSWQGFIDDPEWHAARDASEQDGKIVSKVEATYMKLVDYSPKP